MLLLIEYTRLELTSSRWQRLKKEYALIKLIKSKSQLGIRFICRCLNKFNLHRQTIENIFNCLKSLSMIHYRNLVQRFRSMETIMYIKFAWFVWFLFFRMYQMNEDNEWRRKYYLTHLSLVRSWTIQRESSSFSSSWDYPRVPTATAGLRFTDSVSLGCVRNAQVPYYYLRTLIQTIIISSNKVV